MRRGRGPHVCLRGWSACWLSLLGSPQAGKKRLAGDTAREATSDEVCPSQTAPAKILRNAPKISGECCAIATIWPLDLR